MVAQSDRGNVVPQSQLSQLIDGRSWPEVLKRIFSHKEEVSLIVHRGFDDSLALHEACKLQPPVDVVEALIEAYEPAVRTKGQWGYLPLHFACKSGASPVVVATLMRRYPAGTRTREDSGKLPLHIACQWGAEGAVVEKILTNHPEGIYVRDDDGKTALDYAKNNFSSHKEQILSVLAKATEYCVVSKAAVVRANEEFESKLRGKLEAYLTHLAKVEKKHRGEIETHMEAVAKLRLELTKSLKEGQSATTQLEKYKKDNFELRSELDSEISRTKNLMEDIATIKKTSNETVEGLRSELSRSSEETQSLNSKLDTRNKEYLELRSELDSELSRTRSLMEDVASLKKSSEEDKKEMLNDFEQEKANMKEEFENTTQQARDALEERVVIMRQDHQKEIEEHREVEQELRSGLESMKNQVELLVASLKESHDKVQAERVEIGKARRELEDMLQEEKKRAEQLEENLRDMKESSVKQAEELNQHMKAAAEVHQERVAALQSKHEEEVNQLREASVAEKAQHREEFNRLMKNAADEHNLSVSRLQSQHEQEVKKCSRVEKELRLGLERVRANMIKLNTDISEYDALPSHQGEQVHEAARDIDERKEEDGETEVEELSNAKKAVSSVAMEAVKLQSTMRTELEKAKTTIASAKQVACNLQSQIEHKQIVEETLRARICEFEDLTAVLRGEVSHTVDQRDAIQKDKEELQFKLLKTTRQSTAYLGRIKTLNSKLHTLSASMQNLAVQHEANSTALLEQEETIRLMKSQNEAAKEELKLLVDTAAELDDITQCGKDESGEDNETFVQDRVVAEVSIDEEDQVEVDVNEDSQDDDVLEFQPERNDFAEVEVQKTEPDVVPEEEVQPTDPDVVPEEEVQPTEPDIVPEEEVQPTEPDIVPEEEVQSTEPDIVPEEEVQSTEPDGVPEPELQPPEPDVAPEQELQQIEPDVVPEGDVQQTEPDVIPEGDVQRIDKHVFPGHNDAENLVSGCDDAQDSNAASEGEGIKYASTTSAEAFPLENEEVTNIQVIEMENTDDSVEIGVFRASGEFELANDGTANEEEDGKDDFVDALEENGIEVEAVSAGSTEIETMDRQDGREKESSVPSAVLDETSDFETTEETEKFAEVSEAVEEEDVPEDEKIVVLKDEKIVLPVEEAEERLPNDVCVGEASDEVEVIAGNESFESGVPQNAPSQGGSETVGVEEDVPDDEKQVDAKKSP